MSGWKPGPPMPRMAQMPFPDDWTDRLEAIEILDICASNGMNIGWVAYYVAGASTPVTLALDAFRAVRQTGYYNLREIYAEAAQRLREGSYP